MLHGCPIHCQSWLVAVLSAPPLPLCLHAQAVLKAWLPLSEAILHMAAHHLPSPLVSAPFGSTHL
jgi:hypothetical protein